MMYLWKDLSLMIFEFFFYRNSLNEKLNGSMIENFPGSKKDQKAKNSRQRVKTNRNSPYTSRLL